MSWNQSTEDEIGLFVAANAPRPISHLPFMVLFDRYQRFVHLYLLCRLPREEISKGAELAWKQSWEQASSFPASGLNYRSWLFTQADQVLQIGRADDRKLQSEGQVQRFAAAIRALPQDLLHSYRARVVGCHVKDIERALQVDGERAQRWFVSAVEQLRKANSPTKRIIGAEMPAEESEMLAWLENTFCSTDFHPWIVELRALEQSVPSISRSDLRTVLGSKLEAVLDAGFSPLSRQQVNSLLQRPSLLEQLQREVLNKGGEKWQKLIACIPELEGSELERTRVALMLGADAVHLNRAKEVPYNASLTSLAW